MDLLLLGCCRVWVCRRLMRLRELRFRPKCDPWQPRESLLSWPASLGAHKATGGLWQGPPWAEPQSFRVGSWHQEGVCAQIYHDATHVSAYSRVPPFGSRPRMSLVVESDWTD